MNGTRKETPTKVLADLLDSISDADSVPDALTNAISGLGELLGMNATIQHEPGQRRIRCGKRLWLQIEDGPGADIDAVRAVAAMLRCQDRLPRSVDGGESHVHALAVVSSGLAHELNNPLAAVMANLELATRQVGDELRQRATYSWLDDLHGELDDARIGADRMHQLVKTLKVLGHSPSQRGVADFDRVVDDCMQLVGRAMRQRGRLHRASPGQSCLAAPAHDCTHAVLAFFLRALQVLPRSIDGSASLTLATGQEAGRAFMTLRYAGPSPKLGPSTMLSTATALARAVDGDVEETTEPEGAMWRLSLPISTTVISPIVRQEERVARILVIDDEPLVGKVLARMLGEHSVDTVTDPNEGLQRALTEPWDLVLASSHFVDGPLASSFRSLGRLLVVTSASPRAPSDEAVLTKPFDLQALRRMVRDALPRQRR